MIIIGLKDCPSCKIVKNILSDIKYIELTNDKSTPEILKIKKFLKDNNPTYEFPVIIDENISKIVNTEFIVNNLQNRINIENELKKQ